MSFLILFSKITSSNNAVLPTIPLAYSGKTFSKVHIIRFFKASYTPLLMSITYLTRTLD